MWWFTEAEAKPKPAPVPTLEQAAGDLIGRALVSDEAYEELVELCDRIGARFNGSPALERAVEWGSQRMADDGLNVHTEKITLPVWFRGDASAELISPTTRKLHPLALGGSVGTPGLEAEVLVVSSFDDLELQKDKAAGKIVVFDVPFTDYGKTVRYRFGGASAAARHGAVAMLVRSITPESLDSPHTGAMRYADDAPKIPAVAITIEDATLLHRLQDRGVTPKIRLAMSSEMRPEAESANTIGDLPGRDPDAGVVVLSCHLDSWDVGQGAQDDGAGCVTVMAAAALIAELPVRPRRGIRVILYAGEEFGVAGGKSYFEQHKHEMSTFFAALEADTGAGQPLGFTVDVRGVGSDPQLDGEDPASAAATAWTLAQLAPVGRLLDGIGAGVLEKGEAGTDIFPLVDHGVPGFGLHQDMSDYWPIHHTEADTVDKVDPVLLQKNVAATAVMAWALAEIPALRGE